MKPMARKPQRVLIIEDNRDAAESLHLLLDYQGFEARICRDGLDGLHMAQQWRPEAVLSDIGLPSLSGYDIADVLRHDPRTERTLLIAITGYGTKDDRDHARRAGFDHFFTKPVNLDTLFGLLGGSNGAKQN
jgi:CheY-like chemotaxis protein